VGVLTLGVDADEVLLPQFDQKSNASADEHSTPTATTATVTKVLCSVILMSACSACVWRDAWSGSRISEESLWCACVLPGAVVVPLLSIVRRTDSRWRSRLSEVRQT